MDSFYDAPRQPPIPTTINKIERIPDVPEVSVVENSFCNHPRPYKPLDFNCRGPQNVQMDRLDFSLLLNQKKQVRFQNGYPLLNNEKENTPAPLKTAPDLKGKTFKQIYMANVPDRHLDLSLFEAPKPVETPKQPEIASTFEKLRDNPVYNDASVLKSIENRPYSESSKQHWYLESPKRTVTNDAVKIVESCNEIAKPSDEPTIKDLYKIIQQQNEQIMQLQRQVNNLKNCIKQPDPEQIDKPQDLRNSPTKKGLFSIDFQTTSFEVSFRPPHGKFRKQDFHEPKIQEIVECDKSKDNQDLSLNLEESLHVKDSYVSAVPSIQINMDEYQSSDEEESSANIGITFYKDLMDQVNTVLKKMKVQSECQRGSNKDLNNQTMNAVKQATLQHLKSIGVNLSPIQETNEITEGSGFDNTEISFAVKQLLMKYLPDDKLTKAINKQKLQKPININEKKKIKPTAEFSFATLQYLKKYNLIDNRKLPELGKTTRQQMGDSPKILDVTALKRQPKLL